MLFSKNRNYLSKMPYKTIINKTEVIDVIADKLKTYEFLMENRLDSPDTVLLSKYLKTSSRVEKQFFLKPRYIAMRGTSRQLFIKIEDQVGLDYIKQKLSSYHEDYVVK